MKIRVVGSKYANYTNADGKDINGVTIAGLITEPDVIDENVEGNLIFQEFFSLKSLPELPRLNVEYEVKFLHYKTKEGWSCRIIGFEEV